MNCDYVLTLQAGESQQCADLSTVSSLDQVDEDK